MDFGGVCVCVYTYINIIYLHIMSSRQNPLHRRGAPIAFQCFVEISILEIQHEANIHS